MEATWECVCRGQDKKEIECGPRFASCDPPPHTHTHTHHVHRYKGIVPTIQLAGAPPGPVCVNWEDQTLWVDTRGNFHSIFHAWRGQPCDYPLPGCHGAKGGDSCTSLGGHTFSEDGKLWFVPPCKTVYVCFASSS
jgi:hypothetical protein